jgi:hypothetical protein
MTPRTRLVLIGAGWALAVAVPADLVAQIADAAASDGAPTVLVAVCVVVVLLGLVLGGAVVGHQADREDRSRAEAVGLAARSGLAAIAVVVVLGIVRRLAAGHSVAWVTVPEALVLGAALGALGGLAGWARARTTGR